MRIRNNLNYIVVYNQQKRQHRKIIQPYTKTKKLDVQAKTDIDEQKVEVKQLTDQDGLDRSYSADNYISIIDNTVYIARTHLGRASDWYDDIFEVLSLWNAVPIINPN